MIILKQNLTKRYYLYLCMALSVTPPIGSGGGLPPSSTREVLVDGGLRPEDTTYQVLKTANEISISGSRAGNIGPVEQRTGPVAGRRSNHTQHHHHQSASSGNTKIIVRHSIKER